MIAIPQPVMTSDGHTIDVLNRLLVIHQWSFPMYLQSARPFTGGVESPAIDTLSYIAADQRAMAGRIIAMLLEAGAQPEHGEFPMEFTDLNDLGIDYLVGRAAVYQRQDIASIERCVTELEPVSSARALAEESLGMAKGHLESLEELLAGSPSVVSG